MCIDADETAHQEAAAAEVALPVLATSHARDKALKIQKWFKLWDSVDTHL